MEAITLSTDLHCNSCVSKISPLLKDDPSIQHYSIDLDHPEKLVTIQGNSMNTEELISKFEHAGFHA